MAPDPPRMFARLSCEFVLPAALPAEKRAIPERAARICPVTETLRGRAGMTFVLRYK